MKIVFFVENNHCGGMDSFFINVINHWPFPEDELCLICNVGHPGFRNIQQATIRNCEFIAHDIPLNWAVADQLLKRFPSAVRRLSRPILRIALFPYQLRRLKDLFRLLQADRLMVVNGAYPGGESCRLASIAWREIGGMPSVHNIRNFAVTPRPILAWYENWIDRRLEAAVHTLIGVSQCCAKSLRLRPSLVHSKKITHIYNGVPLPTEGERDELNIDLRTLLEIGTAPMCLMLATYELRKGHEFLFKAFKRVSERFSGAHLVICGDGSKSERDNVESLRVALAPKANIHLLEFIPEGKKLIQQADILLVASQEWESFGWTVIEAMIRGVPVVSTDSGGLAEVVGPNGVAGFSINHDDIEGYAAAICKLIADRDFAKMIAGAGRRRAMEFFTVDRMAHEYALSIRSGSPN